MFIVFEGNEGSGKSTQAKLLTEKLRSLGKEVLLVREPGGTPVGEQIRTIFKDKESKLSAKTEMFLLLASRSQLIEDVINPALAQGKIVIADRFYDSTMIYQSLIGGLWYEDVVDCINICVDSLKPDLTIFFDAPLDVILNRIQARGDNLDRLERRGADFITELNNIYKQYFSPQFFFNSITKDRNIVTLHTTETETPEEVFNRVWNQVKICMEDKNA